MQLSNSEFFKTSVAQPTSRTTQQRQLNPPGFYLAGTHQQKMRKHRRRSAS
jgi:hypothetical protein